MFAFIHLVYSSSKANDFLSYDKCMQRMKCPVNRKEECSEECHAGRHSHTFSFFNYFFFSYLLCYLFTIGNTEEEIEEHTELTISEHREAIQKKPKPKFETNDNYKKQSNKVKHSSEKKQQTDHSTLKTDL
jgi:hypothetical protein